MGQDGLHREGEKSSSKLAFCNCPHFTPNVLPQWTGLPHFHARVIRDPTLSPSSDLMCSLSLLGLSLSYQSAVRKPRWPRVSCACSISMATSRAGGGGAGQEEVKGWQVLILC